MKRQYIMSILHQPLSGLTYLPHESGVSNNRTREAKLYFLVLVKQSFASHDTSEILFKSIDIACLVFSITGQHGDSNAWVRIFQIKLRFRCSHWLSSLCRTKQDLAARVLGIQENFGSSRNLCLLFKVFLLVRRQSGHLRMWILGVEVHELPLNRRWVDGR